MRPPRLPLWAKILSWFFLNVAVLAIVGALFAAQKLRFGLDAFVAGAAGDRLRAVGVLVMQDFYSTPREQWNEVLSRYEREYGLQFSLFSVRGDLLAGASLELPHEVATRLRDAAPPPRPGPPPADAAPRRPQVVGLQRAGDPPHYWIVLHTPLPQLGRDGPAMLVLRSDSLGAGGLIFDLQPLLWAAAAALALSVLLWLPLIIGMTRCITALRDATARIAGGRFDVPVPSTRRDELGELATAINSMSERIAGLLHGQRRFLSDVAHELCAPLSRLQLALGIAEAQPRTGRLDDIREEVDQMSALVNELLSFSRASLGQKQVQLHPVPVRGLLERAISREAVGGEPVHLTCDEDLHAQADADLLFRAVANLLRNAIRYAGDAGPIHARAERDAGRVRISICDSGPGIPAEALPQIFDPFYRLDASRTRDTGGVGLGLTIAKTCVEACGGKITAANTSPAGLCVAITLQAAASPAHVASAAAANTLATRAPSVPAP